MALNFDLNAHVKGNVVGLIALSGKFKPGETFRLSTRRRWSEYTYKVSHILLDRVDLVRGKTPDIFG